MGRILIGTSAWSDHDPFYPPGTKPAAQLPFYARYFPVVEVNTTYYRVTARTMVVNRWGAAALWIIAALLAIVAVRAV